MGFKFDDSGNSDTIMSMNKCYVDLKARIEIVQEDGIYCATSPDIPGLFTQADTHHELQENIKEAISLLLDSESIQAKVHI